MKNLDFLKSKKLIGYVVTCGVMIVSDALGMEPATVEQVMQLSMVYLTAQGSVDLAGIAAKLLKRPSNDVAKGEEVPVMPPGA